MQDNDREKKYSAPGESLPKPGEEISRPEAGGADLSAPPKDLPQDERAAEGEPLPASAAAGAEDPASPGVQAAPAEQGAAPADPGPAPAERAGAFALPAGSARAAAPRNFAARMGDAGYVVGRRYDAIKNAFLSYRPAGKKGRSLRARITRGGETFGFGRTVIAKLCLVGGYLRLFLALDPKAYNVQKYHQKDYSEVARYAKRLSCSGSRLTARCAMPSS